MDNSNNLYKLLSDIDHLSPLERINLPQFSLVKSNCEKVLLALNVVDETLHQLKPKKMIYLPIEEKNIQNFYRNEQMRKGYYIGHHFDRPAEICVLDSNIFVFSKNATYKTYQKLLWSYIIKYVLTIDAFRSNALHLKASALLDKRDNKIELFIGRGGSGKTTLCDELIRSSFFSLISNQYFAGVFFYFI